MNHEIWQPVVGFESRYEVSDYGKVRSLVFKNRVTSYRYDEPLMLKLTVMKNGYLRVNLHENGKNLNAFVHRIVLGAFVGPCPNGYQACHYNGIKDDNRLDNLGWVTGAENQKHRENHGTALYGENNPSAKITNEQAIEIYRRTNEGKERLVDVARDYGIAGQTVSDIKYGRKWKKVLPLVERMEGEPTP